ncbi:FtsH protease activity modulator HflK [Clostridium sp. Marseille-P299]|uniref:FtsH protease activity modulator HflK n=1 Tax=Clostridium sp. Marseille-P299 TaxID=1805477 RepID=UPI00082DAC29|nr:FtsH protease activity modulator HflK [Clostridium sp. Marseille-P299]
MRDNIPVKHVVRTVVVVAVIVALLVIFGNSMYTINEQEQAVVTTFGKASTVNEPGLHFKIPFIQEVTKVDTTIKGFAIGYDEKTGETISEESLMITSDYNFVNVDFYVEYKVIDPVKALYASDQPVEILKNLAQSCIRAEVGSYDVDSVITTGKNEIQNAIREKIVKELEKQDIGVQLINLTIQDAEPPTEEVMEAFKAVETAKQGKETAINNANKYRNEELPASEASIDQILKEAEATKEARINEAEGQVARFNAMYAEYIKFPLITKQRMFYEAMEDILPDLKVIIDNTETGTQTILPLDSFVQEGE